MVFLYSQTKHSLIPQADSEENLVLAQETKEFRNQFFPLLHNKITEMSAAYSESDDSEIVYRDIRRQLDKIPEVQAAHQRRRILQDRLWKRVAIDLKSDRARLIKEWESSQNINQGNVELNSDFDYPRHQLKADIHRMPGGYLQDDNNSDFWTGATYDHGVFLYGMGWFGGLNDELGHTLINNVLLKYYPELTPQKILDMGCSVGHSTLPYVSKYPNAEVWGIDLGASLLRYASARAKALNKKVYFAQQNAEKTKFADNSFDLVVSHILLHEIPCGARKKVFAESFRLLKKGGIMIHLESQLFLSPPNMVARYFRDTEVWVNSEPYLGSSKLEDFEKYSLSAGFDLADFQIYRVPAYYAQQRGEKKAGWMALCATKR
ncbi:SAM-dependent methyltransferase [Hyella patelloides LEGE 07179]|uniref:SAM-dependent methyltransferase n=1 Tax=Hyella patelloides LEGE 07179 TaxID=945734 RepID=A0A563W1B7_9CYAN|nr:class I SAM-dependent methyltransferase [Hyella patelloides]VEP17425.1 SAM-dependent methyltransferase [Hyella patelloides LEGE 07179]